MIQLALDKDVDPTKIDKEADRVTDGLDDAEHRRIEQAVATMNAMYGAPARIRDLVQDLVTYWEARRERMKPFVGASEEGGEPGKAMVVCATREICVRVYDALCELRPEWHSDELNKGALTVERDSDHCPPISIMVSSFPERTFSTKFRHFVIFLKRLVR